MSAVSLRPYLPADAARCAAIFRASVEELASEDYGDEQCEAWAARADDAQAFAKGLAGALTLIALIDGEPVGFASLKGADVIEMLYVDPAFARRGVGDRAARRAGQARRGARREDDDQRRQRHRQAAVRAPGISWRNAAISSSSTTNGSATPP